MQELTAEIAVLTVIPKELAAARAALSISEHARHKADNGTVFYSGIVWSELQKRDYSVVLACIGGAGNAATAAAVTEVVAKYHPRTALLMGIAAGIRGKVKIGHTVISERVVAYEPAAAIRLPTGESIQQRRTEMYLWHHSINQDVVNYAPDIVRIGRLFEKIGGTFPVPLPGKEEEYSGYVATTMSVAISTIASGEKLLRDPSKLHVLREEVHGKIEVGEMEAAGFAEACRRSNVDWLVIRGISDFGDELKDDRFHDFAALSSAATLVDFIRYGLDLGPLIRDADINDIISVRETLIREPLLGATMLSDLLARREEWARIRATVDLMRARIKAIDDAIAMFGPAPTVTSDKNQAVYNLIGICLDLEQEVRRSRTT